MSIRITSFRMNFLSFSEKVRIARPLFPPSPRLRLVKNVTDTKLVKYLAKYRRFSIGSLRKTADGLYCFIGYFFFIYLQLCIYYTFVCIQRALNSLKEDNKNYLSILYKQRYSVSGLIDKTAKRA